MPSHRILDTIGTAWLCSKQSRQGGFREAYFREDIYDFDRAPQYRWNAESSALP